MPRAVSQNPKSRFDFGLGFRGPLRAELVVLRELLLAVGVAVSLAWFAVSS